MSKTSTPCILPRISKRSRPVDWSRSVGTVPGSAPGGRRSSSVLTSVDEMTASACSKNEKGEGVGVGGLGAWGRKGPECNSERGWRAMRWTGGGVEYLRKEPSSCPARLALDLRLPLLLLVAIAISIQDVKKGQKAG